MKKLVEKKLVIVGFSLVIAAEVAAFALLEWRWVLAASGVAVAAVLLAVCWSLLRPPAPAGPVDPGDIGVALRRWRIRTETLISRADSTRRDWDRHLRPMLARQFESAVGQQQRKDPAAFRGTGEMLLGPQLWPWVDPDNIASSGGDGPGPGRAVLEDILHRLERV